MNTKIFITIVLVTFGTSCALRDTGIPNNDFQPPTDSTSSIDDVLATLMSTLANLALPDHDDEIATPCEPSVDNNILSDFDYDNIVVELNPSDESNDEQNDEPDELQPGEMVFELHGVVFHVYDPEVSSDEDPHSSEIDSYTEEDYDEVIEAIRRDEEEEGSTDEEVQDTVEEQGAIPEEVKQAMQISIITHDGEGSDGEDTSDSEDEENEKQNPEEDVEPDDTDEEKDDENKGDGSGEDHKKNKNNKEDKEGEEDEDEEEEEKEEKKEEQSGADGDNCQDKEITLLASIAEDSTIFSPAWALIRILC